MPVDIVSIVSGTVGAVFDLLVMSLIVAIPAFFVTIAAQFLNKKIRKKMKLNWMQSALITSFLVLLPLVFIAYLLPYYIAFTQTAGEGAVPEFAQMTAVDYGMAFFLTVLKNTITAIVFAVLLLPLLFLGAFASEYAKKRFRLKGTANTFAAVYCTALVAWIIILAFPWIYSGMIYFLYWGSL